MADDVEYKLWNMKFYAYVLVGTLALLFMAAGSKHAKLPEGLNPGDLAPRIEIPENGSDITFRNSESRYTLLNFWAAYDAESRLKNVQLSNAVKKMDSSKIAFYSVSLDENPSVFKETVRLDQLPAGTQFQVESGTESEIYKDYALEKGLRNFLIDGNGMIVAVNVAASDLEKILN